MNAAGSLGPQSRANLCSDLAGCTPTQTVMWKSAATLFAAVLIGLTGVAEQRESPGRIPLGKLKDHPGKVATVCGRVVTHDCADEDRSTTLDLDKPYWEKGGAVLITEQARRNFPRRLEDGYALAQICATGTIERREDRYVVRVERPDQITVEKQSPAVPFSTDAVRPCDHGVRLPTLIREVRPNYTREAMRAQQQGRTFLEGVVHPNGSVGEVRVLSGFQPSFGLDEQAVIAVKQWRFKPGTAAGREVPVIVTLELSFTLK